MFENIFGNVQQQQADLQKKLAQMEVEAEAGDGAVTVKATGDQQIENIKIDPAKVDTNDLEQLEDLILVAVNRALDMARQKANEESAQLIKDMFPLGDLDQFMKDMK